MSNDQKLLRFLHGYGPMSFPANNLPEDIYLLVLSYIMVVIAPKKLKRSLGILIGYEKIYLIPKFSDREVPHHTKCTHLIINGSKDPRLLFEGCYYLKRYY